MVVTQIRIKECIFFLLIADAIQIYTRGFNWLAFISMVPKLFNTYTPMAHGENIHRLCVM